MLTIAGLHHGGAERVVANLTKYLDRERFEVSVCWHVALGDIGRELRENGVRVFGVPEQRPGWGPYRRFLYLRQMLKEEGVDLVHSHDTACLADATQARAVGARVKHVHTFHFGNYPNLPGKYLFLERVFNRFPDQLIAVGTEQKNAIVNALKISPEKVSTVYNGVAAPGGGYDSELVGKFTQGLTDPLIIGSISTLTEQKGLSFLIDAAGILKQRRSNFVVLIAGDGPLRPELEQQAKQLRVDDVVKFVGWLPGAASKLLPALDVFVQSSLWEANSMVLLEAMAAGCAIVTTNVGESRHVVDSDCGYVVPSRNALAIADKVDLLLGDACRRNSYGVNARNKFERQYTVAAMADRYSAIYESVLG
ncbi:MAG: glycosyltransferase family 4 protein [Pseudomonadales bacterium]